MAPPKKRKPQARKRNPTAPGTNQVGVSSNHNSNGQPSSSPSWNSITRNRTEPFLPNLLRDPNNWIIQQSIFSHLNQIDFNSFRATNSDYNEILIGADLPPNLRLANYLTYKCDEYNLNQYLQSFPGYYGHCPNDQNAIPRPILIPCEDVAPQDLIQGRMVNVQQNHLNGIAPSVCDTCRNTYWNTLYIENNQYYVDQYGPSTNAGRLADLIREQRIDVCKECDLRERRQHPDGFNGCVCHDMFSASWRCMQCTRETFGRFIQEFNFRMGRRNHVHRVAGRLRFDRQQPRYPQRCLCDRGFRQRRVNGLETDQCIRCEGYIVRFQPHNLREPPIRTGRLKRPRSPSPPQPPGPSKKQKTSRAYIPLRRSERIKSQNIGRANAGRSQELSRSGNRVMKSHAHLALRMLISIRGQTVEAAQNEHGFVG